MVAKGHGRIGSYSSLLSLLPFIFIGLRNYRTVAVYPEPIANFPTASQAYTDQFGTCQKGVEGSCFAVRINHSGGHVENELIATYSTQNGHTVVDLHTNHCDN